MKHSLQNPDGKLLTHNLKKDAEEVMVLALPYLEQALDFKPLDRNTMTSLRDLYARTDDQENWKEMQEMLEN